MMKQFKLISLLLFFTMGLIIPSCEKDSTPTSCDGVIFRNFFDITAIDIASYSSYLEGTRVSANDTISFNQLDKIFIDYLVDYVTFQDVNRSWSFSLIPTANACTYIPGSSGSKEEAITSFSITTLNDFDAEHLANTSINDLFEYHGDSREPIQTAIPLTQFLAEQTANIAGEDMVLALTKAPELNQEFKVKVVLELSTGEVHEVESEAIFITP